MGTIADDCNEECVSCLFWEADVDGDEQIMYAEFAHFLQDRTLDIEECEDLFWDADIDGNEQINYAEFTNWFESMVYIDGYLI